MRRAPTALGGELDHDALFSSARAGLKHTEMPVEAPINPLWRKGQPTVHVDNMAAFLSEMKTVRLRKVNQSASAADLSTASMPTPGPSSRPFEAQLGNKRKAANVETRDEKTTRQFSPSEFSCSFTYFRP